MEDGSMTESRDEGGDAVGVVQMARTIRVELILYPWTADRLKRYVVKFLRVCRVLSSV